MEQKMTKSQYMLARPPMTLELIEEAKAAIFRNKFNNFFTKFALISKDEPDFLHIYDVGSSRKDKYVFMDKVIATLKCVGQIKEIDVREDDETVRFWVNDSEYAIIPYVEEESK